MGYLKGRFLCLRGLRTQIKQRRDHEIACLWITACVILHNLIIDIEGEIDDTDPFYQEILQEGVEQADNGARESIMGDGGDDNDALATRGQQKRNQLKCQLLADLARMEED